MDAGAPIALVLLFFLGACCAPLPRLSSKHAPFPAAEARHPVDERAEVWRDAKRDRDVPVRLYIPRNAGRAPVVVFSHGIGEDRDSYAYLGRAWAAEGFLAVHVTHAGTDRAMLERGYRHLYRAVQQRENWVNRPLDVSFVLDQLAARAEADLSRVAVVGHSAGAFTAFAVAGIRTVDGKTPRDERVRVIIPISMPKLDAVIPPDGYDELAIPVLHLTGTCDTSIVYRTFPRHRRIPFERSRAAQQYLVTLEGINHDTFSNRHDPRHPLIARVTTAFLRAWLRDDRAARAWFDERGNGALEDVRVSVERK